MNKMLLLLAATALPSTAFAAGNVTLASTVMVERTVQEAGQAKTVLAVPKLVTPGEHLVFELAYHNVGATPATEFVVTNPLPASVVYETADSAGATVSVDGGKSWGALAALKVRDADGGVRAARAEDVTDVRWTLKAIPAGGGGKLSFRGTVR